MLKMKYIMIFFGSLIFIYMLFVVSSYVIMLVLALVELRKQYKLDKSEMDDDSIDIFHSRPVSIIVPAYNEEVGIVNTIQSLLSLQYSQTEVIVVDDGSIDNTKKIVMEQFKMRRIDRKFKEHLQTKAILEIYKSEVHHNLYLIVKENGGKADALNVGINFSKYPYFCSIDADSILEQTSLMRVMHPIAMSNEKVIAVGGNIRIANGQSVHLGSIFETNSSNGPIVSIQIVEYLRAFLMGRIALSKFNLVLIISGAFSVFAKKWAIEVGGYSTEIIGEDMELVLKLQRYIKENKLDKSIRFVPDPVCWTEAPQKLSVLRKQRRRWQQGLIESLWKHRDMLFNPKYGRVGFVSLAYYWIVEAIGPFIELGGYIYVIFAFFMGSIYYEFAILLSLLFILYGSILSCFSVLFEAWGMNRYPSMKSVAILLFVSLTEVFWYKPMTLVWRFEGFIRTIQRSKDWGDMEKVGLSDEGDTI